MKEVIIRPLSVFVGHEQLYHRGLDWNVSQKLTYYNQFIPSIVRQQDTIAVAYEDSLMTGATTGESRKTVTVAEAHDQDGDGVESQKCADTRKMRSNFFYYEVPEKCVPMPSLVPSVLLICL